MHIPTHLLSAWCIANHIPGLSRRERLFAMVAATAADLDGLGMLISDECYCAYHHVLDHNLLWGTMLSAGLAWKSAHRRKCLVLYLALFHMHLLMDYYGSGRGWGIAYFWPFSKWELVNDHAWEFSGWQNKLALSVFTAWSIAIFFWRKRTPLELVPHFDRHLVNVVWRWLGRKPAAEQDRSCAPLP